MFDEENLAGSSSQIGKWACSRKKSTHGRAVDA